MDTAHRTEFSDWIPSLSQLIQIYFVIITTIAFLAASLPTLRDSILTYGKLDSPSSSSSSTSSASPSKSQANVPGKHGNQEQGHQFFALVKTLRVPKTWFAHFYVFATLWMIYLSLDLAFYVSQSSSSRIRSLCPRVLSSMYPYWSFLNLLSILRIMPSGQPLLRLSASWTPPPEILLAMSCYLLHLVRRWYECWFVERPSAKAKIHVGHYLVGISFYAAMAPSLWIDAYEAWILGQERKRKLGSFHSWMTVTKCVLGLMMFLWGSWHQHKCHVILANLRSPTQATVVGSTEVIKQDRQDKSDQKKQQEYKVPFGDWFEYMVAPHYTAEMVLYFGFYLMASSSSSSASLRSSSSTSLASTLLLAWIWVIVNLGILARETDHWYRARFGDNYAGVIVSSTSRGKQQIIRKTRAVWVPFLC